MNSAQKKKKIKEKRNLGVRFVGCDLPLGLVKTIS